MCGHRLYLSTYDADTLASSNDGRHNGHVRMILSGNTKSRVPCTQTTPANSAVALSSRLNALIRLLAAAYSKNAMPARKEVPWVSPRGHFPWLILFSSIIQPGLGT